MTVHVLGVNGSLRTGSSADRALLFALRALAEEGARCETFEVGSLPLHDGRRDEDYPASVAAWRAACHAADALLVVVPSFHGGMPGGLKNAFDLIDTAQMGGKPFGIIGIAGGDAEPGVTDAARVLRHIGGIAGVPDVVISRSREHWGEGEEPRNKGVAVAITKVAADLVTLCTLRAAGKLPSP